MEKLIANEKNLSRFYLLATATPLIVALLSQYVFGLHPCHLCIFQRIPYAVMIFFSLLAVIWPKPRMLLITLFINIHAFLVDSGIAFYHVGVERHWWGENGGCTANLKMDSIDALRASLIAAPAVRCDEVQFQLLGISMAGWNCIYCLVMAIFTIIVFIKYFKLKRRQALSA